MLKWGGGKARKIYGFTLVELLVVTVVISLFGSSFVHATVTPQDFADIRARYPDLKISQYQNISDFVVTEITTAQLNEANLRTAIDASPTTPKPHLIVVRTDNSNHTITLSGTQIAFPYSITGYSVYLVSLGPKPLTIDANNQSRIFYVDIPYPYITSIRLAGLVLTGGNATTITAARGGAVYCAGGYFLMTECEIKNNTAQSGGGLYLPGGINLPQSSVCIMHSSIHNNIALDKGGGLYGNLFQGSHLKIFDNQAKYGGGAYPDGVTFRDSLFFQNTATSEGGGLCIAGIPNGISVSSVHIYNTTITANSAPMGGGVSAGYSPPPPISLGGWGFVPINSIIFGNNGGDIYGCLSSPIHCLLPSLGGWSFAYDGYNQPAVGYGNLYGADPKFVNPLLNDYRLSYNSPAIDTGSTNTLVSDVDLDGNPRIVGGNIDIGAYEYECLATLDIDGNGTFDPADANLLLRYLYGYSGTGLTQWLTNTPAEEIVDYIETNYNLFDIDGNGTVDPADANLMLRYLYGYSGIGLTQGLTNTPAEVIVAYIESHLP